MNLNRIKKGILFSIKKELLLFLVIVLGSASLILAHNLIKQNVSHHSYLAFIDEYVVNFIDGSFVGSILFMTIFGSLTLRKIKMLNQMSFSRKENVVIIFAKIAITSFLVVLLMVVFSLLSMWKNENNSALIFGNFVSSDQIFSLDLIRAYLASFQIICIVTILAWTINIIGKKNVWLIVIGFFVILPISLAIFDKIGHKQIQIIIEFSGNVFSFITSGYISFMKNGMLHIEEIWYFGAITSIFWMLAAIFGVYKLIIKAKLK